MRTKLKLPVYFGALVLALTASVVSCSKDSTAPQSSARVAQQKSQDSQESSRRAGKYHTDALVYVFAKLSQANKNSTKGEKCRIAMAALKEFDKSFRKDARSTAFVGDGVCGTPGATGDIPQFGELSVPSLAGAGFSPQAASMLTEIGNVTNTHASSASVVAAVTGVQNSAGAKLSPAEASAVAAAGSVAISSAEYWEANAEKWRGLSSTPGVLRKQISTTGADGTKSAAPLTRPRASLSSDCCGGIAAADITTFISSLMQGWFMGVFDVEQASYRATVASIIAGLRLIF